jgi:hypothetical protein
MICLDDEDMIAKFNHGTALPYAVRTLIGLGQRLFADRPAALHRYVPPDSTAGGCDHDAIRRHEAGNWLLARVCNVLDYSSLGYSQYDTLIRMRSVL